MFEAQEKQKSIILKKYVDQKNRLNLEKDIDKRLKKAEDQVKKIKKKAQDDRMAFM